MKLFVVIFISLSIYKLFQCQTLPYHSKKLVAKTNEVREQYGRPPPYMGGRQPYGQQQPYGQRQPYPNQQQNPYGNQGYGYQGFGFKTKFLAV